jgi:hypothetical protein
MNEDRLLKELGDLARQEDEADRARFDERWDRLAAGTLSPEEDAELRALASASPDLRETYEAFRPLGPEFQARVVEAAAKLVQRPEPQPLPFPRPAPHVEVWLGAEAAAELAPPPRVRPFRRATAWLGAAAALAAGLFLVVHPPGAPLPPLPIYKVDPILGVQSQRGEPTVSTGLPVFGPGSLLTVNARPSKPVEGPVEARGFVRPLSGGNAVVPLDPQPPFKIENGAVRLRATLGQEIRLTSGDWRLWIVVGRPGKIPTASALAEELRAGRAGRADWQAVPADLRVDDRAPP